MSEVTLRGRLTIEEWNWETLKLVLEDEPLAWVLPEHLDGEDDFGEVVITIRQVLSPEREGAMRERWKLALQSARARRAEGLARASRRDRALARGECIRSRAALRRIARMIEGWQAAGEVPAEELVQYLLDEVRNELKS